MTFYKYLLIITIFYESLQTFTTKKGRCSISYYFVKEFRILKNPDELFIISIKIRTIYNHKMQLLYFVDFLLNYEFLKTLVSNQNFRRKLTKIYD